MSEYKATIGLEVHAELSTRTKMFCDCVNDPDEDRPNVNTCPVCLGHPGALPTINKEAVERVIKVGLAIGGHINELTKFDRKNYFYPDLPKGYQISQFDLPLVVGGVLAGVKITRIHLEEDAGKLVHAPDGKSTLVDFNRGGVALMELVTEPVIRSAAEAIRFARELQLLLRYLGVSDADLERGQMRADANVSVSATEKLGTRVEVKNLNSWSSIEAAINHEIKRQTDVLEKGGEIDQETRGWDTVKLVTKVQRSKEHAHDYRYFPDPDLPAFETAPFNIEELRRHLPELPEAKRARFVSEFGLTDKQAVFLVEDKIRAEYFENLRSEVDACGEMDVLNGKDDIKKKILENAQIRAYNYLANDLQSLISLVGANLSTGYEKIPPKNLAMLAFLVEFGTHGPLAVEEGTKIGRAATQKILAKMFETGEDTDVVMAAFAKEGDSIHTISDETRLRNIVKEIIMENPKAVADYKAGKEASVQFMIGKAMGKLRGTGDPGVLKEIFIKELA